MQIDTLFCTGTSGLLISKTESCSKGSGSTLNLQSPEETFQLSLNYAWDFTTHCHYSKSKD